MLEHDAGGFLEADLITMVAVLHHLGLDCFKPDMPPPLSTDATGRVLQMEREHCLGGTFEMSPGSAACGLTCRFVTPCVSHANGRMLSFLPAG